MTTLLYSSAPPRIAPRRVHPERGRGRRNGAEPLGEDEVPEQHGRERHDGRREPRDRREPRSWSGRTTQATRRDASKASTTARSSRRPSRGDLDREQNGQEDAAEDQGVDDPRGSEQQRELHDALRLQEQERRAHEEDRVGTSLMWSDAAEADDRERRPEQQHDQETM